MIKALIFDLDGTLIDSIGDIAYSVNIAFKQCGFKQRSEDEVRLNVGKGFRALIKGLLKEVEEEKVDEITNVFQTVYAQHYCERTKAYEGIHELLNDLQKTGIKLAVNSNKKDEYTKNLMKKIFSDINFFEVIGERDGIKNKPDPYSAHEIINKMEINLDESLYIGDSEVDIKTAKNGNLKSIACLWGLREKAILEKEEPNYYANKPSDIKDIILTINKEETC